MTLDEFVTQQIESIKNFEQWWKDCSEKDGDFPDNLPEPEWLEQYEIWAS